MLKSLMQPGFPKKFILDFETAVWQNISLAFPNAAIQGCSFHFKQAIRRKISVSSTALF